MAAFCWASFFEVPDAKYFLEAFICTSTLKIGLCCGPDCLLIAKKIELRKYITTGNSYKGLSRSDDKITGDGLEALLGAIYLDQGIRVVEKCILNLWDDFLDKSSITKIDAKTQLQE